MVEWVCCITPSSFIHSIAAIQDGVQQSAIGRSGALFFVSDNQNDWPLLIEKISKGKKFIIIIDYVSR
ncbi:MAG: hypothetical protein CTY18_01880 [Methylomonas sp.]|nr:MAG: hypothetical protein CTY18_01880 [Methylomonas sp.]